MEKKITHVYEKDYKPSRDPRLRFEAIEESIKALYNRIRFQEEHGEQDDVSEFFERAHSIDDGVEREPDWEDVKKKYEDDCHREAWKD